jgi:apolipoprotein D and lipocalin family protein
MKNYQKYFLLGVIMFFSITSFLSCGTKLKDASGINNFDVSKYLGKWYEVARYDSWFENNMDKTQAFYSLNEDGTVRVENSGFDTTKEKWKTSVGKAKFRGAKNIGELKVSFFGPFYADYTILALDSEYKYSLVSGGTTDYLWILSRTKTIPEEIKNEYLSIAKKFGFDTSNLVWVNQNN